jgi:hypothetical protein
MASKATHTQGLFVTPPSWPTCGLRPYASDPDVALARSDGEGHRHRLRMDRANFSVWLRRQERVKVVRGLAFLDLPHRRPVGPEAGETGKRAGLIDCEPDVASLGLVEFVEAVERHHAAVLRIQPPRPVLALHVADVGRAAVRLHPEQLLEIDRLAPGLELRGALLGRLHQRVRRRWHAPSCGSELAAHPSRTHDWRRVVQKYARYRATSESEKISFNQLNRKTGHRIKYAKVDADTGEEVPNEDIVKGYKIDTDTFVQVSKEQLENVALESTRTIEIDEFVDRSEIDPRYLIRPYYLRLDGNQSGWLAGSS